MRRVWSADVSYYTFWVVTHHWQRSWHAEVSCAVYLFSRLTDLKYPDNDNESWWWGLLDSEDFLGVAILVSWIYFLEILQKFDTIISYFPSGFPKAVKWFPLSLIESEFPTYPASHQVVLAINHRKCHGPWK